MALLALVGVFAVYKLQTLRAAIVQYDDALIDYYQDMFQRTVPADDPPFVTFDIIEHNVNTAKLYRHKNPEQLTDVQKNILANLHVYSKYAPRRIQAANDIAEIRNRMKQPLLATSLVIVASLVGLLAAQTVHHCCLIYTELVLFILVALLDLFALLSTYRFISSVV